MAGVVCFSCLVRTVAAVSVVLHHTISTAALSRFRPVADIRLSSVCWKVQIYNVIVCVFVYPHKSWKKVDDFTNTLPAERHSIFRRYLHHGKSYLGQKGRLRASVNWTVSVLIGTDLERDLGKGRY